MNRIQGSVDLISSLPDCGFVYFSRQSECQEELKMSGPCPGAEKDNEIESLEHNSTQNT